MAIPGLAALGPYGALAAGGIGLMQGVVNAIPTKYDKENKAAIADLEKKKNAGLLGLSPEERAARERSLMSPVRAAQTQSTKDQAQLMAQAGGGVSGGDLSRLRTESARNLGAASATTATTLDQMNEEKKGAQTAELEERRGVQEQRRTDRINGLFGGLSEAAGAMGQAAGQPPGGQTMAAKGGGPLYNPRKTMENMGVAGLPANHSSAVTALLSQPGAQQWVKDAAEGNNLDDPHVAYLRSLMVDGTVNQRMGGDASWKTSDAAYKNLMGSGITLQ